MKVLITTLALLMVGLAFIAPPLIAVLPVLLVGLILMASPLMLASLTRGTGRAGRARDDDARRRSQRPTSSPTAS